VCERDRGINSAGDAAYLVTVVNKNLFHEVRHHQVVFNNQNLEHALSFSVARSNSDPVYERIANRPSRTADISTATRP
jgi:hypothetical protein